MMVGAFENPDTSSIEPLPATEEFLLALGNLTAPFDQCWTDLDASIYRFWMFIQHYETVMTYFINLLPNVLSYAFFIPDWIDRIKGLIYAEDFIELTYVFAVIIRKILVYEYVPD
jgi:hypothetical protein